MPIDFTKYPLPIRMRHHTAANLYIKFSELKETPEHYPPLIDKINWSEIFKNGNPPDLLDVGCGKGKLLLEQSENYPEKNILGIEVRYSPVEWLNDIIQGENITNAAVFWYSVVNGMSFIENESISQIYYLFPDPWPKRKHHKRRAFTSELLGEFARIIKKDGKIHLATDVPEVHKYHLEVLNSNKDLNYKLIENDEEWGLPITNKERFCRKTNIAFDRIIAYKI
jgi:tRNA (guanine-N7-)-methyltransferase